MRIVWLASFPKSGNTWLRFLVYSYMYGPPQASSEVGERIPDIHHGAKLSVPPGDGQLFVKTHLMPGPNHPFMDRTQGFVYVVRHPKDVLLSNLNYARLASAGDFDAKGFAIHFIRHIWGWSRGSVAVLAPGRATPPGGFPRWPIFPESSCVTRT
jgi:hypothetical protein